MRKTFKAELSETKSLLKEHPKDTYDPDGLKKFILAMESKIKGSVYFQKQEGILRRLAIKTTVKSFFKNRTVNGSSVTISVLKRGVLRISDENCPDYWTPYPEEKAVYYFSPLHFRKEIIEKIICKS